MSPLLSVIVCFFWLISESSRSACVRGLKKGLLPPWMLNPSRKAFRHLAVTPTSAPRRWGAKGDLGISRAHSHLYTHTRTYIHTTQTLTTMLGCYRHFKEAIRSLSKLHSRHLRVYDPHGGTDDMGCLTSQPSTSSFHDFSTATACRDVSVCIPDDVSCRGCGYFEDRRPAANCDPYNVMRAVVQTCLLGAPGEDDDEERESKVSWEEREGSQDTTKPNDGFCTLCDVKSFCENLRKSNTIESSNAETVC